MVGKRRSRCFRSAMAFLLSAASVIASSAALADPAQSTRIASLSALSLNTLKTRFYAASATLEQRLPPTCYDGPPPGSAFVVSYRSDGLREYARVDVPAAAAPVQGYPVIVFAHGWVGLKNAPGWSFNCNSPTGYKVYTDLIGSYTRAGFVVVTPGYRGHGQVDGRPAEGIEFLRDWDNGSYLSPQFYAIDVLNLVAGLRTLQAVLPDAPPLDLNRLYLKGHSQGGDVALTVAAVMSGGKIGEAHLAGASIWAGTFAPPLVQLRTYRAMESAPQAFLAGDGHWNGSAVAADGRRNPDFVFGYPTPAIGDPDPALWTWQKETWHQPSYAAVLRAAADEMYHSLVVGVADMPPITFTLHADRDGRTVIRHAPQVAAAYKRIGGEANPDAIRVPLILHHSDHDFYSPPQWNHDLCARLRQNKTGCVDELYPGNTHELGLSAAVWFTPVGSEPGFAAMIERDVAFFTSGRLPTD